MTDTNSSTMFDAEWTAFLNRRDRERREAAFDMAIANYHHFEEVNPDENVVVVEVMDAIEDHIFAQPIETLGDCRLFARVWLERCQLEAHERRLLEALAALPEQFWEERIGLA